MTTYDLGRDKPHGFVPVERPKAPPAPVGDDLSRNRSRLMRRIGVGVAVVLGLALASGGLQHYRLQQSAAATLQARENAVPAVRVEPVRVSNAPHDAGHDGRLRECHHLCPPERLYRRPAGRYRQPGQDRRPAGGDPGARDRR